MNATGFKTQGYQLNLIFLIIIFFSLRRCINISLKKVKSKKIKNGIHFKLISW